MSITLHDEKQCYLHYLAVVSEYLKRWGQAILVLETRTGGPSCTRINPCLNLS